MNGSFKSKNDIVSEFNIVFDVMKYNSLKAAIPKHWLKIVKSKEFPFVQNANHSIKILISYREISKVSSKQMYWVYVEKEYIRPTAIGRWEEYYFFANLPWDDIFMLPYLVSRETSLQSIQYQIIHRYISCGQNLDTWFKNNAKCRLCNNEDTIKHLFYHCAAVKSFWLSLIAWWENHHQVNIKLGCLDIIFGLLCSNNDDMLLALNYCIIFGKAYIH